MSTRYLEDELDAIVRLILPLLERSCFTCGSTKELQVGHLFERRHRLTRWDTNETGNNHLQCPNCNSRHEAFPDKYRNMFTIRFGERAYADVADRAHSSQKLTYSDLLSMLEEKESQLRTLRGKAA
jgi:Bacteriophage Lambda NinG protein